MTRQDSSGFDSVMESFIFKVFPSLLAVSSQALFNNGKSCILLTTKTELYHSILLWFQQPVSIRLMILSKLKPPARDTHGSELPLCGGPRLPDQPLRGRPNLSIFAYRRLLRASNDLLIKRAQCYAIRNRVAFTSPFGRFAVKAAQPFRL